MKEPEEPHDPEPVCRRLLVAEGSWQLIGQDVPPLHSAALVLQAVRPVAEGVALRVAAQTDAT